jgi:hypothetical protein
MRKFRAVVRLLFLIALPASAEYSCPEMLAQVKQLFADKDPALLTVDITRTECPASILYETAYYQGFAFYLLGEYPGALADLELARSIAGPWDEQILYYIWKIQGKLGEERRRRIVYAEFAARFPESAQLAEMKSADEAAITWWEGSASTGLAYLAGGRSYAGAKSRSNLNAAWNQERGRHAFQEFAGLSGNFSLDGRKQHFAGVEAGGQYRWRYLTASGTLGRLRSIYKSDTIGVNPGGRPVSGSRIERRWEWQRSLSLSQAFPRPRDWEWTASLNYYETDRALLSMGPAAGYVSLGGGWDLDRFRKQDWTSLGLRAEYQGYDPEAGCPEPTGAVAQCEASRLVAAESAARVQWFHGRRILGTQLTVRGEKGVGAQADSAKYWRTLATVGAECGLRLGKKAKWINSVDAGADVDERRFRPVFDAASTLSLRF